MIKSNIEFLKNQFTKALSDDSLKYSTFRIDFDPTEETEPKTNFDEIMVFWALPKHTNKDLKIDEVCRLLVTTHNEIPLWIKLEKDIKHRRYQLYISKRFRKLKVIEDWHKSSKYMPIIK